MRNRRGWLVIVGAATVGAFACEPGSTGRTIIDEELRRQVPWTVGASPLRDGSGMVILPDEPVYPPIATGQEDPGSRQPDCSALQGVRFSEVWFEDFEADPTIGDSVGVAAAWASSTDDSEGSWRVPGEINWYLGLSGRHGAPWGLPARRVEGAPSCDGEPNEWAFNFRGGRFNRFGADFAHPFPELEPCPQGEPGTPDEQLCPDPDPLVALEEAGIDTERPDGETFVQPQLKTFWDLSGFDGIAFWARRGPEGIGSLSVVIQDKHTSEDLNREINQFCRRVRDCNFDCLNRQPCTPVEPDNPDSIHRCFDPDEGETPAGVDAALLDELFPRCGPSACTYPSTFPDPDFGGKECRPYVQDTHGAGEFCFDEDDPPPPDSPERCGDGYAYTVNLSTDWQFFLVPFSEMRQQGFGKPSPFMDLSTIRNIAFVVSTGWADAYLDDLTLYWEPDED